MNPVTSVAALLQEAAALAPRLIGHLGSEVFDLGWLKEVAGTMNTVAAQDGLDTKMRLWAAEWARLNATNARLDSELAERRRAQSELKDASRRKDDLLSMVAHELRNPLNAIQGALELVGRREATAESLEVARKMIGRQVRNISRLIDDLLDVYAITQHKLTLKKQIVSLGAAVESAIDTCRPLLQSRQHKIVVNMPAEPILLEADPGRLEQVFSNLLCNSAKYMEPGGWLSVTGTLECGQAILRVKDGGFGMTEEALFKVFDLFVQVNSSLGHALGGLGIGLALVKSLVELHGGSVKAESGGLGSGSEFTVRLPASSRMPTADGERPRVQVEAAEALRKIQGTVLPPE